MPHTETSPPDSPPSAKRWPLWLFVAGCLGLNVVLPSLFEAITDGPATWFAEVAVTSVCGVCGGEICFVVVLAALTRRTWFGGFLLGILLLTLGVCALVLGLVVAEEYGSEIVDTFITVPLIPGFLLAAAGPLYVCRQLFGWRLARSNSPRSLRQPLGLGGIFSLITVLAAAIVLFRAPQVSWEVDTDEYWPFMLLACTSLLIVGLLVLPLCVRIGFGKRHPVATVSALVGISVGVILLLFAIAQGFYPRGASWSERRESFPYILGLVVSTTGLFYVSLWALRFSGFELVRDEKQVAPTDAEQLALRSQARSTVWRIATAIAITMAVSVGLARLQAWRVTKDSQNLGLAQYAEETGGSTLISRRRVLRLTLGEHASDEGLVYYRDCSRLEVLHLDQAPITDAGFAELEHFPRLQSLTLEDTEVTDAGLLHLRSLRRLDSLSLRGDALTGSGIVHLGNHGSLRKLSLVGTTFGDKEGSVLESFHNLHSLDVSSTQITDQCLQRLGGLQQLNSLTAHGTRITARDLPHFPNLGVLGLDETQFDDESVGSLTRHGSLWNLSLKKTKITNAGLKELAKIQRLMFLGVSGTDIDDVGVRELRNIRGLLGIHLSDTRVTGSAFASWNPASPLRQLRLDRTGVDDAAAKHLVKLQPWTELSLSGTKLTDACLVDIAKMGIDKLDLSHTQVTAKGILANGMLSVGALTLSSEQVEGVGLQQLQTRLGIDVKLKAAGEEGL